MMSKDERNGAIISIMEEFIQKAIELTCLNDEDEIAETLKISPELIERIERIIRAKAQSIREVLITCCVGFILEKRGLWKPKNPEGFRPSVDYYDLRPRGVIIPIVEILRSRKIPHTKDGPINIVKGRNIDESWTYTRRRRDPVKYDLFQLLKMIENDYSLVDSIFSVLMLKMLKLASEVRDLEVKIKSGVSDDIIFNSLSKISHEAVDAGHTPHNLVSILLSEFILFYSNGSLTVLGEGESANATDTTSKKPGDFSVAEKGGKIVQILEVTMKIFDEKRMSDSVKSLNDYESNEGKLENPEVIVLCRVEDTPNKKFERITFEHTIFHFISIDRWIMEKLTEIGRKNRLSVFNQFTKYVNNFNTEPKVKEKWLALTRD